jgi:hypothetical protein
VHLDHGVEIGVGRETQPGRAVGADPGGPGGHHPGHHRVGRPVDEPARLGARHPLQRLDHLSDAHGERGQVDRAPAAPGLIVGGGRAEQPGDGSGRRDQRRFGGRVDRAGRALAGQRLPDDAGEEARRRPVGAPRAHADRRQPDRPSAQEALAGVIGQQLLADDLLRAVAGLRVRRGLIGHDIGQGVIGRGAEGRHGTGVDHDRSGPERTARSEQRLGGTQVRPDAEVKIGLALAADRRGQVEDDVGAGQQVRPGGQQFAEVAADGGYPLVGGQVLRHRRLVGQGQPGERARAFPGRVQRPRDQQFPGQARPEETCSPSDHHVHHGAPLSGPFMTRHPGPVPGRRPGAGERRVAGGVAFRIGVEKIPPSLPAVRCLHGRQLLAGHGPDGRMWG